MPNNADWDCFKSLTSREILRIRIPLLGEHCAFLEVTHLFRLCEKQTAVSTETEIISLVTGLRLDGMPALELWDLIVSVLGNISRVSDKSEQPEYDVHKHHKSHNKIDVIKDIDAVPSNVQSSRQEA